MSTTSPTPAGPAARRSRRFHRLAVIALAGLATVPGLLLQPPALACDSQLTACQLMEQQQSQEDAAQRQLDGIEASIQNAQARANAIAGLIGSLQAQVAAQQRAIQATEARIQATEREIRLSGAELMRVRAQLAIRQQLLDQRVAAMDDQGPFGNLQIVVGSTSFTQFVNRTLTIYDVLGADQRLIRQIQQQRSQVQGLQAQLKAERAQETALLARQQEQEQQLDGDLATQQQALSSEQQLEAQLQAQGAEVRSRIASLASEIASLTVQYQQQLQAWLAQQAAQARPAATSEVGGGGPVLAPLFSWVPPGGYPDPFPFGQCTWWAAYNHRVTWWGNATDWYANAAAQGVPESQTPRVGAIAVWRASPGYSIYGHVAIVVAVNGDGSFVVSEMNYLGLGIIDQRVAWPDWRLEGFID
jgi:peptidoglycan hydrolase CwlO-like protein